MNINEIVAKIVELPRQFVKNHNVSFYQLLKDSGYFEKYSEITIRQIKAELIRKPELIQFWLDHSEDQRTSGGWYFIKKDKNVFIVGNQGKKSAISFANDIDACSNYIKNEIEEIRKI